MWLPLREIYVVLIRTMFIKHSVGIAMYTITQTTVVIEGTLRSYNKKNLKSSFSLKRKKIPLYFDLDYSTLAVTKPNIEQSGLGESMLYSMCD